MLLLTISFNAVTFFYTFLRTFLEKQFSYFFHFFKLIFLHIKSYRFLRKNAILKIIELSNYQPLPSLQGNWLEPQTSSFIDSPVPILPLFALFCLGKLTSESAHGGMWCYSTFFSLRQALSMFVDWKLFWIIEYELCSLCLCEGLMIFGFFKSNHR